MAQRDTEEQKSKWGGKGVCFLLAAWHWLLLWVGGAAIVWLEGTDILENAQGQVPFPVVSLSPFWDFLLLAIPLGNWKSHFWNEATDGVMWTFFHQKNVEKSCFHLLGVHPAHESYWRRFFIESKVCKRQWSPTWLSIGIPVRISMNMHLWPNIMPSEWVRIFRVTRILNFQSFQGESQTTSPWMYWGKNWLTTHTKPTLFASKQFAFWILINSAMIIQTSTKCWMGLTNRHGWKLTIG